MIYLRHIYRHSDIDMTNWNYIIKQAYYCNLKIYISTIVYSTDTFENPNMKFILSMIYILDIKKGSGLFRTELYI